jgi:hypothetical protein
MEAASAIDGWTDFFVAIVGGLAGFAPAGVGWLAWGWILSIRVAMRDAWVLQVEILR